MTVSPSDPETPASPAPGDGQLDSFVGYHLKRASLIVETDFRAAMGPDGMSPRLFSALCLVVDFPDISQSEVARRLGIERSGLVAMVDELERRGHVARVPVPGDRRVQALRPTEAGQAAMRDAIARAEAHEQKLLGHLDQETRQQFLDILKSIRTHQDKGST